LLFHSPSTEFLHALPIEHRGSLACCGLHLLPTYASFLCLLPSYASKATRPSKISCDGSKGLPVASLPFYASQHCHFMPQGTSHSGNPFDPSAPARRPTPAKPIKWQQVQNGSITLQRVHSSPQGRHVRRSEPAPVVPATGAGAY